MLRKFFKLSEASEENKMVAIMLAKQGHATAPRQIRPARHFRPFQTVTHGVDRMLETSNSIRASQLIRLLPGALNNLPILCAF